MANTLIDLLNNIIKYNGEEIIVVFDENEKPWFSAIQVAKILEYEKTKEAIRNNVSDKRKAKLEDIVDSPEDIHKNAQPHSIYINQNGLYELMASSHKKSAKLFRDWIFDEVIPKIVDYGEYHLSEKLKKELEMTNEKLHKLKQKNKILEDNQKKVKYPKGDHIYIIKSPTNEKILYKIGITNDLEKRINSYNTVLPNKIKYSYYQKVDDMIAIENCLKGILHKYIYRANKEYYKCSFEKIIDAILNCDNLIKEELLCCHCKNKIDSNISRHILEEIEVDESIDVTKEVLFEYEENENNEDPEEQNGGNLNNDFEYKYLKYKYKYLEAQIKLSTK